MLDFGFHQPPGGGAAHDGYFLFKDDGSGKATEVVLPVRANVTSGGNGHSSHLPGPGPGPGSGCDWLLSDTYPINDYQYLFLFHRPTKRLVPLARLKSTADWKVGDGMWRVDLHPRPSRDGRIVSIDSTHEGLGRQMYMLDIGLILDHPPKPR